MRCQKIGWDKVKSKALPHKSISRKVKGKTMWQTLYSSPKNIGASPLLNPEEKTLLKSLAHIGYHEPMQSMEEKWKALSSEEQHDHYYDTIKKVKDLHMSYCESASRVCGRQYKRRRYFEKVVNKQLTINKKKKSDPKALSKHLADITKEVFSDSKIVESIPLQTSTWCLVVNTMLEDIAVEVNNKNVDVNLYFDMNKGSQVKKSVERLFSLRASLVIKHKDAFDLFTTTNQYSALDDDDDDESDADSLGKGTKFK
jgi:hypothetical protein